jgi:hypothetical protein
LHSRPASSQPFRQAVITVTQAWVASHVPAEVWTPSTHDGPAPHDVPTGLLLLSAQTGIPVVQEIAPFRQGLPGGHAAPVMQATQVPALQTRFVPQLWPFGAFSSVSVQTALPVAQLMAPT